MGSDLGVKRVDEEECDRAGSSGDAGFDIIATVKFDDNLNCNFGILGQCGAQEEGWPKKTLEAHSINLSPYFHTTFAYPSVMFTPVFYRDSNGQWVTFSSYFRGYFARQITNFISTRQSKPLGLADRVCVVC